MIKILLNSFLHDIMNYQTSSLCYLPQPLASADNSELGVDKS